MSCIYCGSSLHSIHGCPKAKEDGIDPDEYIKQHSASGQTPNIMEDPPEVAEVSRILQMSGGG